MEQRYQFWILDGRTPVPCYDPHEWAAFYKRPERIIKQEDVNGVTVSTIFLGLDHCFSGIGPPILFETMIFPCWPTGGESGNIQLRCSTYMQAEEMHQSVVEMVHEMNADSGDIMTDIFARLKVKLNQVNE